MLQLSNTRYGSTFHRAVAAGVTILTEGVPLVQLMENGSAVVRPCTGAAGEIFAGFSYSRNAQSTRMTMEAEFKVPATAPYVINLPKAPIAGQFKIGDLTAVTDEGDAPTAAQYALVDKAVTVNAALAGQTLRVSLAFEPTYLESIAQSGNSPVGGLPSTAMSVIGVIKEGDVFTDQYDVTSVWNANGTPSPVFLGANGLITSKAGGVELKSVQVIATPSVGNGFIGLSVRSAS